MTEQERRTTTLIRRAASLIYANTVSHTTYGAWDTRLDNLSYLEIGEWWKDPKIVDAIEDELLTYAGVSDIEREEEDGVVVFNVNLYTDYYDAE